MSAIPSNNLSFFVTVFFTASGNRLQITQFSDPEGRDSQLTIPRGIELPLAKVVDNRPIDGRVATRGGGLHPRNVVDDPVIQHRQ